MLDTETQYSVIWKHLGDKYNAGVENFEQKIKGTTLPNILKKYFSHLSQAEIESLIHEHDVFEENMKFIEIPGSIDFVKQLKEKGFKVGLVTSSSDIKMNGVNQVLHFNQLFDTIVTASRVKKGKPDPECYLLAAKDLNVKPEDCIVFEDSLAGIEAATKAGMRVIGLSTTHAEEMLKDKCYMVIPDFKSIQLSEIIK